MKYILKTVPFAAVMVSLASSAWAITPNAYVSGSPLVNPNTAQVTDVWRFAGYITYTNRPNDKCSATQISREWVLATNHCGLQSDVVVFRNGWSNDPAGSTLICSPGYVNEASDLTLCRLNNPERFSPSEEFPPIADKSALLSTKNDSRGLGSYLYVGYSGGVLPTMNFTRTIFNMPQNVNSYNILDLNQLFKFIGGDSGGGVYFFGVNNRPVLIFLIGSDETANGIDADWLKAHVLANAKPGERAPIIFSGATVATFAGLDFVPSPLPSPPSIRVTGPGNVVVNWSAPILGASAQVDDYVVYEGIPKQPPRLVFLASSATATAFTGVPQTIENTNRRLCVAPRNDGIEAINNIRNCTEYNSIFPQIADIAITSSGRSTLKTVTTSWRQTSASPPSYKVDYTTKLGAGATRAVSVTTLQNSISVGVPVNTQFCIKVTPTTNWAQGTPQSLCKLIQ